jgi:uncharacterized protein YndB with AHSA1/START domain
MSDYDSVKCDFVYAIHIGTTAEKLWQALTNGEFTRQYWGGRAIESSWEVGAPVKHVKPDGGIDWQGQVLVAEPPKKLVYTFAGSDWNEGEVSQVTWTITPSGPDTVMLQLQHEQLTDERRRGVGMGWPAIVSNLKSLLESGTTLNFFWKG